jgi:hypothetical protein
VAYEHAIHHGTAGDRQAGTGDVDDDRATPPHRAIAGWATAGAQSYRQFIIGPLVLFLPPQRMPDKKDGMRGHQLVWWMNALLLVGAAMSMVRVLELRGVPQSPS